MDLKRKLTEAVEVYNNLLVIEQQKEQELAQIKEQRTLAYGKVQGIDELFKEEQAEIAAMASENGHDEEQAEPVVAEVVSNEQESTATE